MRKRIFYITEFDMMRLNELLEDPEGFTGQYKIYLRELEEEFHRCEVVETTAIPEDVITINSTVLLEDLGSGEELIYSLVFPNESDIDQKKISILSPVGIASLGHRIGNTIKLEVPAGLTKLKVKKIFCQPKPIGKDPRKRKIKKENVPAIRN